MKKSEQILICILILLCYIVFISLIDAAVLNVPADYTSIQDAIDNATAGDIINVSAGTYDEDLLIPAGKNNLEIYSDASATIKGIANVDVNLSPLAAPNIEILSNGVRIHGFIIESPDYESSKYTSGIIIGSKDVEIYDNDFIINSAETVDEVSQAIQTYSKSAMPGVDISGLNIHDNTFTHKHNAGDFGYEGIYINPDEGFTNAYIEKNDFSGEILRAVTSERSGVKIKNNRIITDLAPSDLSSGGSYQGINIRKFDSTSQENIFVEGNTIKGSASGKGFFQGIRLGQSGQNFSNVNILNNILNYNDIGILVKIAEGLTVNYNQIVSNVDYGIKNEDSDTLNGKYNYWGACNGPSGAGSGSGDKVSSNVDYEPWIGICIENKTNVNCAYETKDVELSANLNGIEADSCWISYTINGINYNKTGSINADKCEAAILAGNLAGELAGGVDVKWNIYANDSLGIIYNNSWKTFYVTKRTELNTDPSLPDGINGWFVTEPEFTLVKDALGLNSYYQWDSMAPILYTGPFGLENIPNPSNISAGTLELNWWSNLGSCGSETRQNKTFYVDLTNPLIKDLIPADKSTVVNNLNPVISAYIDEIYQSNSGIDDSSIIMKIDNVSVSPNITILGLDRKLTYTSADNLSLGEHVVYVYAKDNAGRESEKIWKFKIYLSYSLSLNVISPKPEIYNTGRIAFDIKTNGTVTMMYVKDGDEWRLLCRDCSDYNRTKSFREGMHNITIKVIDELGNSGQENIVFIVDSQKPKITRTSPKEGFAFGLFEAIFKEENPVSLVLHYGNSITGYRAKEANLSGCSEEKGKTKCDFNENLTDYDGEEISYWFNITDIINYSDSSKPKALKVDLSPPEIDFFNYTINNRKVDFILKITEPNFDEIRYMDANGRFLRERALCSRLDENGICKKSVIFTRGEHDLTIIALDEAGNRAEIKGVEFEII
jgi:hypothetical protein